MKTWAWWLVRRATCVLFGHSYVRGWGLAKDARQALLLCCICEHAKREKVSEVAP